MEVSSKPSLFIHSKNDLYGVTLCSYWNAYFNDNAMFSFLLFHKNGIITINVY